MNFLFYLTMILFLTVCLFLILLVLIQKGRGGGLASAFGGAGGNTAFGSKTGDVLTWATSIVFGIFLVLGVTLNLLADHKHRAETGQVQVELETTDPQPQVPPLDSDPAAPRVPTPVEPEAPTGPTSLTPDATGTAGAGAGTAAPAAAPTTQPQ
jgi:preprotein translocase subunit SecG